MDSEPKIAYREAQHYVGIRAQVTMPEMGTLVPPLFPEVFDWLAARRVEPADAPFLRFLVIDMEKQMEVEVGVPVADADVAGDNRVHRGVFPAGRYVSLVHTGHPGSRIEANAALQAWAAEKGIVWQSRETEKGTAWAARAEFELTDPDTEPDMEKWQAEIVYLIAE